MTLVNLSILPTILLMDVMAISNDGSGIQDIKGKSKILFKIGSIVTRMANDGSGIELQFQLS